MAFEGSQTDVNAALLTLAYKGAAATVTVAASPVDLSYYASTGNYYKWFPNDDLTEIQYLPAQAATMELYQCNFGYLATVTSSGEDAFLLSLVNASSGNGAVIGASDADAEGVWKWIDGPEAG